MYRNRQGLINQALFSSGRVFHIRFANTSNYLSSTGVGSNDNIKVDSKSNATPYTAIFYSNNKRFLCQVQSTSNGYVPKTGTSNNNTGLRYIVPDSNNKQINTGILWTHNNSNINKLIYYWSFEKDGTILKLQGSTLSNTYYLSHNNGNPQLVTSTSNASNIVLEELGQSNN